MSEAIKRVEQLHHQLISTIVDVFDELAVILGEGKDSSSEQEVSYSLHSGALFQGKRPLAVVIDGERFEVKTWISVPVLLFKHIAIDAENLEMLLSLRDKIAGRRRSFISANAEKMSKPQEIAPNLFIETYFDTPALMGMILKILADMHYDPSRIKIAISL